MGIDVPAFGRRVDRPEDFEAERNELIEFDTSFRVNAGAVDEVTFVKNQTDSLQFLQIISISQIVATGGQRVEDMDLGVRIGDSFAASGARLSATGPNLTETLPGLPLEPQQVVEVFVSNQSSIQIAVETHAVLRQGSNGPV